MKRKASLNRNKDSTLFEGGSVVKFRGKDGTIFSIEVIKDPDASLQSDKEAVLSEIRALTMKSWADPGDAAARWLRQSHILLLARHSRRVHGMATARYLGDDVLFFPATIVLPESSNKGLGIFMNEMIIRAAFKNRVRKNNWKPWRWMQPIYVVFRTPSPRLYKMVSSRVNVVPSVSGRQPTDRELEIATEVSSTLCPGYRFDPQTFVNERADSSRSDLIYQPWQIPWSDDSIINEFFQRNLNLGRGEDKEFIVVGRVGLGLISLIRS